MSAWNSLTEHDKELIVNALRFAPANEDSDWATEDELDALATRLEASVSDPMVMFEELLLDIRKRATQERDVALVETVRSLRGMCDNLAGACGSCVAVLETLRQADAISVADDEVGGVIVSARGMLLTWKNVDGSVRGMLTALEEPMPGVSDDVSG